MNETMPPRNVSSYFKKINNARKLTMCETSLYPTISLKQIEIVQFEFSNALQNQSTHRI